MSDAGASTQLPHGQRATFEQLAALGVVEFVGQPADAVESAGESGSETTRTTPALRNEQI
jgi:hypothetical protein